MGKLVGFCDTVVLGEKLVRSSHGLIRICKPSELLELSVVVVEKISETKILEYFNKVWAVLT